MEKRNEHDILQVRRGDKGLTKGWSMDGVNSQLQAHFDIGMNVGLSEAQMKNLITVLEAKVGKKEADNANAVLNKALSSRAK